FPNNGPERGETLVRISGNGFENTPSLSCKFGETVVSAAWISGQLIECFSPAMPESTVRLGVSSNGVDFSYGSIDFVY
ncbi:hypothetical protein GUITHDRAFT_59712, partial [Guillardia theta CCMP2712]